MKTKMTGQSETPQKNPAAPNKGNGNHTEINPAKPANTTEVDLDKSKTKTYPGKKSPEQH